MFGKKTTRLEPTAMGMANAKIASHFRRLQTGSSVSRGDRFCVSSTMPLLFRSVAALRHQDDVAVSEVEVLLLSGDAVVVEGDPLHRLAIGVEDHDARTRGKLREPPCHGEDVEYRRPALQLVAPWLGDLADDRHLEAADFGHDDGNLWTRHVVGKLPRENLAELERREAPGLHVVEERKGDLAVRPHWDQPGQSLVLPHRDLQEIFGADPVGLRCDAAVTVRSHRGWRLSPSGSGGDHGRAEEHARDKHTNP